VSASSISIPDGTDYIEVSGTTTINQLVPNTVRSGREITLAFQSPLTLTFNSGTNGMVLDGSTNLSVTADSMITFRQRFDGKWYEMARAVH